VRVVIVALGPDEVEGVDLPHLLAAIAHKLAGAAAPAFPELTPAEHRLLDLIAEGLSNSEIAKQLFLSPKTVSNRVSVVFRKLQVPDRARAIVRAREAGLGRKSQDHGVTPS
jgi:DNA-binding NarL/FixJ family response regulator